MDKTMKKQRSRNFPSMSLKKALERVRLLSSKEGANYTPTSIALKHWNYSLKSSTGIRAVSALNQFGLLDDQGRGNERRIRSSKLATTILEHPDTKERKEAIKEAALRPTLYKEIWERFDGNLPSIETLKWDLTGEGDPSTGDLNKQSVDEFIGSFFETLVFADLIECDNISDEDDKQNDFLPERSLNDEVAHPVDPSAESNRQSLRIVTEEDFELPFQLGSGVQGVLRLPRSMTPKQWEKFESVIESTKNLRILLVDDTHPNHDSISTNT